MTRLVNVVAGCLGCSLLVALAGCGNSAGAVSGKVLFQGQPLPAGRIVFLCQGGSKPVLTADIKDGAYAIADAPAGPAQVTVTTYQTNFTPVPGMVQSPDMPTGQVPTGPYVPIPARYGVPDSSGLTYDITPGSQTKDFQLTP
jgi:hypothetical protein